MGGITFGVARNVMAVESDWLQLKNVILQVSYF